MVREQLGNLPDLLPHERTFEPNRGLPPLSDAKQLVVDVVYGKRNFRDLLDLVELLRIPFMTNMGFVSTMVKRVRTARELYKKYRLHTGHPQHVRHLEQVKEIEGKALSILDSLYASL